MTCATVTLGIIDYVIQARNYPLKGLELTQLPHNSRIPHFYKNSNSCSKTMSSSFIFLACSKFWSMKGTADYICKWVNRCLNLFPPLLALQWEGGYKTEIETMHDSLKLHGEVQSSRTRYAHLLVMIQTKPWKQAWMIPLWFAIVTRTPKL
jgi:hypothetical protein